MGFSAMILTDHEVSLYAHCRETQTALHSSVRNNQKNFQVLLETHADSCIAQVQVTRQ